MSHASVEEEKFSHTSHSETCSVASGKMSVSSGTGNKPQKLSKVDKLANKYSK